MHVNETLTASRSKTATEIDVRRYLAASVKVHTKYASLEELRAAFGDRRISRPNRCERIHRD